VILKRGMAAYGLAALLAAILLACSSTPPAATPTANLSGTSWRLVQFTGGDGAIRVPDDRSKYTIGFGANDVLNVRFDCNRGRGSWKSSAPGNLEFGPLGLTRMACPTGSLHDQMLRQWPNVRSYVIKNGRLYLSLMADGGIYEFEAAP